MDKELIEEATRYYEKLHRTLEVFKKEVGVQFSIFGENPVSATLKINNFDCSAMTFAIFLGLLLFHSPTWSARWKSHEEMQKKQDILRVEHFLKRLGVFVNLLQRPEKLSNWLDENDDAAVRWPFQEEKRRPKMKKTEAENKMKDLKAEKFGCYFRIAEGDEPHEECKCGVHCKKLPVSAPPGNCYYWKKKISSS